jgi:LPXTG-motif cell wall-anchored protein
VVPPAGGGAGGGASTTAAGGAASGQLARTGADLDAMALAAAATTALGGVFLALGRRRRPLGA